MKKDILTKAKGKVVTLADGKEYLLAPFNLNTLANMEEAFGTDMDKLTEIMQGRTATVFRKLLHILLLENYPDMTLTGAGSLVELDIMGRIVEDISSAMAGIQIPEKV